MTQSTPAPDVAITLGDGVSQKDRDHAEATIESLVSKASRPVIFVRLKLAMDESRPRDEQALAQGTIDMSGAILRAESTAASMLEAVEALATRLERRMRRLAERREDASQRPPSTPDGQWRSGDLPSARPTYFARPKEDRRIERRKAFAPHFSSIDEALFDLEVLDHRFFLFTDAASGGDAIVFETEDGVAVRTLTGEEIPGGDSLPGLAFDSRSAQVLTDEEAANRLDVSGAPFIFFRQSGSDRGAVLYRRYDGHYGLIEPAG
ncbi:MAG TPA: sigma 54 modulation/S30EA ribosomal C-terminal domain-containing protein [Acidimicrobiia bacterium]|nr:sigma 54 modulation/S30EA ribosomal C-terminal domain-containing protein [Acidimicrobiia bacterium]